MCCNWGGLILVINVWTFTLSCTWFRWLLCRFRLSFRRFGWCASLWVGNVIIRSGGIELTSCIFRDFVPSSFCFSLNNSFTSINSSHCTCRVFFRYLLSILARTDNAFTFSLRSFNVVCKFIWAIPFNLRFRYFDELPFVLKFCNLLLDLLNLIHVLGDCFFVSFARLARFCIAPLCGSDGDLNGLGGLSPSIKNFAWNCLHSLFPLFLERKLSACCGIITALHCPRTYWPSNKFFTLGFKSRFDSLDNEVFDVIGVWNGALLKLTQELLNNSLNLLSGGERFHINVSDWCGELLHQNTLLVYCGSGCKKHSSAYCWV